MQSVSGAWFEVGFQKSWGENYLHHLNVALGGGANLDMNVSLVKGNDAECGTMGALGQDISSVGMIDEKLRR